MLPGVRIGMGSTGQFLCGNRTILYPDCGGDCTNLSICDKISYNYMSPKYMYVCACVCVKTGLNKVCNIVNSTVSMSVSSFDHVLWLLSFYLRGSGGRV